jgi:hypothetical protein
MLLWLNNPQGKSSADQAEWPRLQKAGKPIRMVSAFRFGAVKQASQESASLVFDGEQVFQVASIRAGVVVLLVPKTDPAHEDLKTLALDTVPGKYFAKSGLSATKPLWAMMKSALSNTLRAFVSRSGSLGPMPYPSRLPTTPSPSAS